MKKIQLAAAVAVVLLSVAGCAGTAQTGDAPFSAGLPSGVRVANNGPGFSAFPALRSPIEGPVYPSWSNPTGQVVRGPHGQISLFAPCGCGGGR
jgi:hypothetical protein